MKQCKLLLLITILCMLLPPTAIHAERKEIDYQVELEYPPYKYIKDGYMTGFDIELSSMIFEKQDYDVHYSTGMFDNVYSRLVQGDIETAGLMAVTERRKQEVLFSDPVFKSYISIYARRGLKGEIDLNTLGKYKIGLGNGQYSETVLNGKLGINDYVEYATIPEALKALERGEVDLLFENQEVVDYLLVEQGKTNSIIKEMNDLYPRDVAFAINKSTPELVSYINERLDELQHSGAFEELYQNYFFVHSDYYKDLIHKRLVYGAIVLFCLLILSLILLKLYNNRLRRAVYSEHQFYEDVIEHSGMVVWAVQADKTVVRFNKFAERMTGLCEKEVLGVNIEDIEGLTGSTAAIRDLLERAIRLDYVSNVEIKLPDQSSEARYFSFRTTLLKGLDKQAADIFVLVGVDIDERKQNELSLQLSYEELEATYEELSATEVDLQEQLHKLQISERRFRLTTEGSGAYMWEFDLEARRLNLSDRWYSFMGYTKDEINSFEDGAFSIVHPDDLALTRKLRRDHLKGITPIFETEFRMLNKDNEIVWFEVRGKATVNPKDKVLLFMGSLIDISERKQAELKLSNSYQELEATYEQLTTTQQELLVQYNMLLDNQKHMHRLAYVDALSNLPNRLCLLESMEKYLKHPGGKFALLFLDSDNFKYINDTLGHKSGDVLIRKASKRLQSLMREGDMLSRLGGDEFVIFIKDTEDREDVLNLAERIMRSFRQSFVIGESNLYVSLSVGISFYPDDGETAEQILSNADVAMYRAKEDGKGTYVVYDKSMHTAFNERMNIEKHLRSAMNNNEFELYYQPQMDIQSGCISGFEALIRWNSPSLGSVSPLSFIQIAEDSRLIIDIGEWVLRESCIFMKGIQDLTGVPYKISVNISIIQLFQNDFIEMVQDSLVVSGLKSSCLELEITESIFMKSFESILGKLQFLKSEGIGIALDDFGTGYSSLSYLQQLPISTLKMDKTFIDSLLEQADSKSFVQSIIQLGHNMGLEVVAEGVEEVSQMDILKSIGCDKIQGFLISRPVAQQAVAELLEPQSG